METLKGKGGKRTGEGDGKEKKRKKKEQKISKALGLSLVLGRVPTTMAWVNGPPTDGGYRGFSTY